MRRAPLAVLAAAAAILARAPLVGAAPAEPPPGPVVASPGYVRYVTVEGEGPGSVAQTLWAVDGSDFAVTGVESPYPFVTALWREARSEEREPEGTGRQWVVETTIAPGAPVGPLGAVLSVAIAHPKQTRLPIPVSGFVRPVFAITPPEAHFRPLTPGQTASARFFVRTFATRAARLTGAACDVPGVGVSLATEEEGRSWWLTVTLGPALPAGPFAGVVRVKTDSAVRAVLELPVSGSVATP